MTREISKHLSWNEVTHTEHREFLEEQENPPEEIIENLRSMANNIFEPVRKIVGPCRISSGYRCPALNKTIGGSKTSAHMDGRALDFIPTQMNLAEAYIKIAESEIPYDQLIFEFSRWLHTGSAREGTEPRRQCLMIFQPNRYLFFTVDDPRIQEMLQQG